MKTKQLIEILKKKDPELEVQIHHMPSSLFFKEISSIKTQVGKDKKKQSVVVIHGK